MPSTSPSVSTNRHGRPRRALAIALGSLAGLGFGFVPATGITWWSGAPVAVLLIGLTVGVGVARAGGCRLGACIWASIVAYSGATLAEYTAFALSLAREAGPTLDLLDPKFFKIWFRKAVLGAGGAVFIATSFLAYLVVRSMARRG